MNIGKAWAIFADIESQQYTDEEKGLAIHQVCRMETKNSITKAMMWRVIWWLLNMVLKYRRRTNFGGGTDLPILWQKAIQPRTRRYNILLLYDQVREVWEVIFVCGNSNQNVRIPC